MPPRGGAKWGRSAAAGTATTAAAWPSLCAGVVAASVYWWLIVLCALIDAAAVGVRVQGICHSHRISHERRRFVFLLHSEVRNQDYVRHAALICFEGWQPFCHVPAAPKRFKLVR